MDYIYVRMYGCAVCTVGTILCVWCLFYSMHITVLHIEFSMVYTYMYLVLHTVVLCTCVCVPVCKYCTVLKGTLYILQYSP